MSKNNNSIDASGLGAAELESIERELAKHQTGAHRSDGGKSSADDTRKRLEEDIERELSKKKVFVEEDPLEMPPFEDMNLEQIENVLRSYLEAEEAAKKAEAERPKQETAEAAEPKAASEPPKQETAEAAEPKTASEPVAQEAVGFAAQETQSTAPKPKSGKRSKKEARREARREARAEVKTEVKAEVKPEPVTPDAPKQPKKDEFYNRKDEAEVKNVYEAHDREFRLGLRTPKGISDGNLMNERLGYKKVGYDKIIDCDKLVKIPGGEPIGIIPKIQLKDVWKKACAYSGIPAASSHEEYFGVTEREWKHAREKIEAYLKKEAKKNRLTLKTVLVQDMLAISSVTYQTLFIKKTDKIIELVRTAILQDIEENEKIAKKWKKIKRYRHKIALKRADGGIFDLDDDIAILKENHIAYLNDIRARNIYVMKNMLLQSDLSDIVKNINEAIKEDKAKRRDKKLAIVPFVFGAIAAVAMLIVAYKYKYTIINNSSAAIIANAAGGLFAFCMLTVVGAAIRAKRRRRKHPDYVYFNKKVKNRLKSLVSFAAVVLFFTTLYFQRYDGYNSTFYYRDKSDGSIAIAGLVNDEKGGLTIPDSIDYKTVTEIDLLAFRGDDISSIDMPHTVTAIDKAAFLNCESLTAVSQEKESDSDEYGIGEIDDYAFKGCVALKNTPQMDKVAAIGKHAFEECKKLGTVSFTNGDGGSYLQQVEKSAFKGCTSLDEVYLGENVIVIGDKAFEECYRLKTASGIGSVEFFGKNAFYNCNSLLEIDLSSAVVIGSESFYSCNSITEVIIPQTTVEIGKGAFDKCYQVSELITPFIGQTREKASTASLSYFMDTDSNASNMTVTVTDSEIIYSKNFQSCPSVKAVILPDKVTTIEEAAFKDSNIIEITLSENISAIADEAFMNCKNLQIINGGENITSLGASAFKGCSIIKELKFPNAATLGNSVFERCYMLESYDIADSITKIPDGCFNGCNALGNFENMESVTHIGSSAFANTMIEEAPLDVAVEIGSSAFAGCHRLATLTVPDTVVSIGKGAFSGCNTLTDVTIPFLGKDAASSGTFTEMFGRSSDIKTITLTQMIAIDEDTFSGYQNLTSVTFGDKLQTIGDKAFRKQRSLRSITVGTGLTEIGKNAFEGCEEIDFIDLSDTKLTTVGQYAFADCEQLEAVLLPATLTEISNGMFKDCRLLANIEIPSNVTRIGSTAFKNCDSFVGVIVPASVSEIGKEAFYNCDRLTEIELNNGLLTVGGRAFARCTGIRQATIPSTVTKMGEDIFYGCSNLETLTVPFIGKSVSSARRLSYITNSKVIYDVTLTSAEKIARRAFSGADELDIVELNSSCTEIGKKAFYNCDRLSKIIIPSEAVYDANIEELITEDVYPSRDSWDSYSPNYDALEENN